MKKNLRLPGVLLTLCTALAAILLTGCSSLIKPVTEQRVVTVPARLQPQVVTTAEPQTRIITNLVQGLPQIEYKTNWVEVHHTNFVALPASVVTNEVLVGYVPAAQATSTIATVRALNSALNLTPASPLVDLGLGLFGAAVSAFAAWKTRKLSSTTKALDSVIAGVETFASGSSEELKAHIERTASLNGVADHLDEHVQRVTA